MSAESSEEREENSDVTVAAESSEEREENSDVPMAAESSEESEESASTSAEMESSEEAEESSTVTAENTGDEEADSDDGRYEIKDFPVILQNPELPTGCEITALTMAIRYYGFPADKLEMASKYLPTIKDKGLYYDDNGVLHGNDMVNNFIGDPFTKAGYICGTGALITAADKYFEDQSSEMRAKDMTGISNEELYHLVDQGIPVVVMVTIGLRDRSIKEGWYTENGEYIDWGKGDHGAVLIGYSKNKAILADPISGRVEYERERFEKIFDARSRQCIILTRDESGGNDENDDE